jgi:hypothetical protein
MSVPQFLEGYDVISEVVNDCGLFVEHKYYIRGHHFFLGDFYVRLIIGQSGGPETEVIVTGVRALRTFTVV